MKKKKKKKNLRRLDFSTLPAAVVNKTSHANNDPLKETKARVCFASMPYDDGR